MTRTKMTGTMEGGIRVGRGTHVIRGLVPYEQHHGQPTSGKKRRANVYFYESIFIPVLWLVHIKR